MSSQPSPLSSAKPSDAFGRLDPKIQRWIWKHEWRALRDVQEAAVDPILAANSDVIIMAATAGGKTEAAFFPICSNLVRSGKSGIRALYVGPLKALINDQFSRLEELCEDLHIPVHRWHGDVAASQKKQLVARPDGILLITPESLEALFVVRGSDVKRIFAALSYVVIDELHSFVGNERGRQLQSLLHRLESVLGRSVPRIALSATLGNVRIAAEFLRPGGGDRARIVDSDRASQVIKLQLRGYRHCAPLRKELPQDGSRDRKDNSEETVDGDKLDISRHLFSTLRGSDNLIFANARAAVEEYADLLRRMSEQQRVPNEFFPHHSSLSKDLREEVERLLKDKTRPLNAVCTTTLELGIDIGTVKSIAQIGPPPSVASMRQRLGRSGRRQDDPAILRLYIAEPEVTAESPPQDTLHPALVQSIAMVNLLMAKWYEPPSAGALHLSTLVQQVLSVIAERGGASASTLWKLLCQTGPFQGLDPQRFGALLRSLGEHDLISQGADRTLLLGGLGERIVNHFDFYVAFTTPEEYRLVTGGRTLGTLPINYPLAEGSFVIFAGRRWKVQSIDISEKVVDLLPAPGGRPPIFGGTGAMVHDQVREEMFRVYGSGDLPVFLDPTARDLLAEARMNFIRMGLTERHLVPDGEDTLLFSWRGDRVMNTILLQLRAKGLRAGHDGLAISVASCTPGDLAEVIRRLATDGVPDGMALAGFVEDKLSEKYDRFLPTDLLNADFASRDLDPIGAWNTLCQIADAEAPPAGSLEKRDLPSTHVSPTPVDLVWNTDQLVDAVLALPVEGPLASRTVIVPNSRVAHALRREFVRRGRSDALAGTRFITPAAAASEVLREAGVEFSPSEAALRTIRLRQLFDAGQALQYFQPDLVRAMPGWDEAFADTITALESADLRPEQLGNEPADPQLQDVTAIWRTVEKEAGSSWTVPRLVCEAATSLEKASSHWPFSGPVLVAVGSAVTAAEARFFRCLPRGRLAIAGARPLREHYITRIESLFGAEVGAIVRGSSVPRKGETERELLSSFLFEGPEVLADENRPRSKGPDGTVSLEEHAGIEAELEATADWVARQVLERATPLEEIAVLVPARDPIAGLVFQRLRRLQWSDEEFPVHVAGGLPLTFFASGTRLLCLFQALKSGLSAESLAAVLPALRTKDSDQRHLSHGASLELVYSLGTLGGSAENLAGALEWPERAAKREAAMAEQLARVGSVEDEEERAGLARGARDTERLLTNLRAVRPAIEALSAVARHVADGSSLPALWDEVRAFMKEWLLLPDSGPPAWTLLDEPLQQLCNAQCSKGLTGVEAIEIIESTVDAARVPVGRYGEPAVFVGTVRDAEALPFSAVRLIGLVEGSLPSSPREDPVLPDRLRLAVAGSRIATAADRALAQLHALDRVVRDTRGTIVFSAPRLTLERSEHEPSSILLEVFAALGRPNRLSGARKSPIPDLAALQRDGFTPGRADASLFRNQNPIPPSSWLDRVARLGAERPASWSARPELDLARVASLLQPDEWTPLDGALASAGAILTPPGLAGERPISPSGLKTLLQCPHLFLFERILYWSKPPSAPPLRELDALSYGSLFHRVAERFFRQHGFEFGERKGSLEKWLERGKTVAAGAFDEFLEQTPLLGDAVRRQQRDRLHRDFEQFLRYDWNAGRARQFVAVERGFGTPPLEIQLASGSLHLRGFIDRLDVEDGRTLVRDLKTGRSHPRVRDESDPDPVLDVQLAVYGIATQALASEWGVPNRVSGAYAYAGGRADPERAYRTDFDSLESQARGWLDICRELLVSASYPRTPSVDDCTYCAFQAVCGTDGRRRAAGVLESATGALGRFRDLKLGEEK